LDTKTKLQMSKCNLASQHIHGNNVGQGNTH
jgi:hypothetical protein